MFYGRMYEYLKDGESRKDKTGTFLRENKNDVIQPFK